MASDHGKHAPVHVLPIPFFMAVPSLKFRPSQRLAHARQFEAVYKARVSRSSGPLVVHAAPNGLNFYRLGLSVGKRAGNAVVRNGHKRRVREAFRHMQGDFTGPGLDVVVSVRAHEPLGAPEYRKLLAELVARVAGDWAKRG